MSADLLGRAAARMRELAEDVPHGPWMWEALGEQGYPQRVTNAAAVIVAECFEGPEYPPRMAQHIASWHPAVTVTVADLLKLVNDAPSVPDRAAIVPAADVRYLLAQIASTAGAVARAYLGEEPS